MKLNLIVDGNFLLNRLVYPLFNDNMLFGELEKALQISLEKQMQMYNFSNVYFVSDSKFSWRKSIYENYKGTRTKNTDIDWDFVHSTYNSFKENLISHNIKSFEKDGIEGDDWIYFLVKKLNKKGQSCLIYSSDLDLTQLLHWSTKPNYVNIQYKDLLNGEKVYIPTGYKVFEKKVKDEKLDLFDLNDSGNIIYFINELRKKYECVEVDANETVFKKLVMGDKSDNIDSLLVTYTKTNKPRGIGEAGVNKIFESFQDMWIGNSELDFTDGKLKDMIIELVIDYKKENYDSNYKGVSEKYDRNLKLVQLNEDNIPFNYKNILETEVSNAI